MCHLSFNIIIVVFLQNTTIENSSESVCVCVYIAVCVCFCMIIPKEIDLGIVVYENNLHKFDIVNCQIKVKVTEGVQKFSPFTAIQFLRPYNSTLVQAGKLILRMYVHLIPI